LPNLIADVSHSFEARANATAAVDKVKQSVKAARGGRLPLSSGAAADTHSI
jgi:hypothetical protein